MDPLPVRVAIVGLIGSAETVRLKITAFLQRNADPGNIAESVLQETSAIESSLVNLRRSIEADALASREHIYIDQLTTVLTGCVKRFSELENLLGGLPTIRDVESRTIDQTRWAQNESRIRAVVETLQPYKVSLGLILELLALQSLRRQDLSLEHMQRDIDQLKGYMLGHDPDLATRINRSAAALNSETSYISSGMTTMTSPTSPSWPGRDLRTSQSERPSHSLRHAFRSRRQHSDESSRRSDRPNSITTSSSSASESTTSGSTAASTSSTSSRMSLAALSDISVYRLPITAEDVTNGHRYIGLALEPVAKPTDVDSFQEEEDDVVEPPTKIFQPIEHHKVLPIHTRPESRAMSSLGFRPQSSGKGGANPTAEIEMSARKYQGYWRASFTANVPAATAMCGCILLVASSSSDPKLAETEEAMERADNLCDSLHSATSPAKVIQTLHSYDLGTILFALKASLEAGQLPMIPTKIAFPLYQKIAEAKGDIKKRQKVWQHLAKALKKVPQETMVPLMFLITIGRKLSSRGLMVDGRAAAVYLMQSFWPQLGSRTLFALDTEAGDAASQLMLDNYDEMPDELPVIMQAINYKFESGSRGNLLTLLTTKRPPRPGLGEHRQSSDTTAS